MGDEVKKELVWAAVAILLILAILSMFLSLVWRSYEGDKMNRRAKTEMECSSHISVEPQKQGAFSITITCTLPNANEWSTRGENK